MPDSAEERHGRGRPRFPRDSVAVQFRFDAETFRLLTLLDATPRGRAAFLMRLIHAEAARVEGREAFVRQHRQEILEGDAYGRQ